MSALRCWYRIDQTLPDHTAELNPSCAAARPLPDYSSATIIQAQELQQLPPTSPLLLVVVGDLWHFLETCDIIMQDCVPSTCLCPGLPITWRVVSRVMCHVSCDMWRVFPASLSSPSPRTDTTSSPAPSLHHVLTTPTLTLALTLWCWSRTEDCSKLSSSPEIMRNRNAPAEDCNDSLWFNFTFL